MPVSKKPRKKGHSGRENKARKKILKGDFKTIDEANKTFKIVEDYRAKRKKRCEQIGWMLTFTDKQSLLEAFTHSFFSLGRFATTDDFGDFNRVSSSLMLGALCHKAMGVQEDDLLKDIQHAAFMTVVCARLSNHEREVPAQNLEPIKHGLIISQELMEYAFDNDRQALINVLKHNSRANIESTPGLLDKHEKFILGKHYETVRAWELEDEELLKAIEKKREGDL